MACTRCNREEEPICADGMCADCYWDDDYERKKVQRVDPVWRYNRLISFGMMCMGLSKAAAIVYALSQMNLDKPPTSSPKPEEPLKSESEPPKPESN